MISVKSRSMNKQVYRDKTVSERTEEARQIPDRLDITNS